MKEKLFIVSNEEIEKTDIADIPLELRVEMARQLLNAEGVVEDLIVKLADLIEKTVWIADRKAIEEEVYNKELKDLRFEFLAQEIDQIEDSERKSCGRVRTGAEVINAISNLDFCFEGIQALKDPSFWQLTEDGYLVVGESSAELPEDRFNLEYDDAKSRVSRLCFYGVDGEVNFVDSYSIFRKDNGDVFICETKEFINESDIIYIKSLANQDEYGSKNQGQLDAECEIWVDAGRELPSMGNATVAYWDSTSGSVATVGRRPYVKRQNCGARAVVRIKLRFEQ